MTDEAALLAAVFARPHDDTPRLVYADWLDDQPAVVPCPRAGSNITIPGCGKPCPVCRGKEWLPSGAAARAEFIRAQCELARFRFDPSGWPLRDDETVEQAHARRRCECVGCGLRRRERELWDAVSPLLSAGALRVVWPVNTAAQQLVVGEVGYECVVRRGFVDELRVPTLATLFGGPCGRCGGEGDVSAARRVREVTGAYTIACPACTGTGTTPGIAAVFAAHPVTRVVVGDREPTQNTRNLCWMWVRECGTSGMRDELPSDVFDALPLPEKLCPYHVLGNPGDWRSYPTRDAALSALSRACVNRGRELAGLEPIAWEPVDAA